MADHLAELALRDEQSGAHPTLDLIARPPAFDIPTDGFDDGEGGLNHVGATEGSAELVRHA